MNLNQLGLSQSFNFLRRNPKMDDDIDESEALIIAPPRRMNIDWHQHMSVIIQAFDSFGYVDTAQLLESELPDNLQPRQLANLRTEFLGGFYEKCAETLSRFQGLDQKTVSGAMKFIFAMWLLERAALQDRFFSVPNFVRNAFEIGMLYSDIIAMEDLQSEICSSLDNLDDFCVTLELRKDILKQLESVLPCAVPNVNVELLKLIKYGISAQIHSCLSHNTGDVIPLYCDHSCTEYQLPTKTIQLLTGHHEGVLCVKFSHNGLYLASGSIDCTAIIWEVQPGWVFINKHVLPGHREAISCVSWSPNDESLLTCAPLEHIKMWDVRTGQCTCVIGEGYQVLRSCAFLDSDEIQIVYGTSMRNESIRLLRNGYDSQLVSFPRPEGRLKVDLAVTPDGSKLIYYDSVDGEGNFSVKDFNTGFYRNFKEGVSICGISVSENGESLILNLSNDEIHVWNLHRLMDRPLTYWNFVQTIDANIPCIGGVDSRFLVSGTQDSKVCIWNRSQATPIAVLSDHESAVRCVSWNPQRPQMLASGSDDSTIRIWGPQSQEVPHLFRHD